MAQLDMSGETVTKEACADWFIRLQHRSSGATHLKPYGVTWCHNRVSESTVASLCVLPTCARRGGCYRKPPLAIVVLSFVCSLWHV